MIQTVGKVRPYKGGYLIYIDKPPGSDHLSDEVTIVWRDERQISTKQQRKARALIAEIAEFCGYSKPERQQMHEALKELFIQRQRELGLEAEDFSLRDCDMGTASEYITFLIDFVLEYDIPTKIPVWRMAEDIKRYVYKCAVLGICAVCRKPAGIHHVDKVGMGRNRRSIVHVGLRGISLCWGVRSHHAEVEHIGNEAFMEKYALDSVVIDEEIARVYKLRREQEERGELADGKKGT